MRDSQCICHEKSSFRAEFKIGHGHHLHRQGRKIPPSVTMSPAAQEHRFDVSQIHNVLMCFLLRCRRLACDTEGFALPRLYMQCRAWAGWLAWRVAQSRMATWRATRGGFALPSRTGWRCPELPSPGALVPVDESVLSPAAS